MPPCMRGTQIMIHRHTGGLEKARQWRLYARWIHRHTGGLESLGSARQKARAIHRHTGGLEKDKHARG